MLQISELCELCAIAYEIYKRNWHCVNHIPGIHDNGPCDHELWRRTLTAYTSRNNHVSLKITRPCTMLMFINKVFDCINLYYTPFSLLLSLTYLATYLLSILFSMYSSIQYSCLFPLSFSFYTPLPPLHKSTFIHPGNSTSHNNHVLLKITQPCTMLTRTMLIQQ